MAGDLIRPADLVTERTSPVASEFMVVDNGVTVAKSKISDVVKAGFPLASQAEAEAGTNPSKAMTPLTTKQAVTARIGVDIASKAQGDKADTAVQPGDLASVATSGAYADLSGKPLLGTAAAENVGAFATAAQGATADSAVQPYPTSGGLAATNIPAGVHAIRTNGRAMEGDGLGGLLIDTDNGNPESWPSLDGRTWHRVQDLRPAGDKASQVFHDNGASFSTLALLSGFGSDSGNYFGSQAFTFDEINRKIYALILNGAGSGNLATINEFPQDGNTTKTYTATSHTTPESADVGHQGLTIEHLDGAIKLWSTAYREGLVGSGRDVVRFDYTSGGAPSNFETFRLFDASFADSFSSTPSIDPSGRYLIAHGGKFGSSTDTYIRVFDLSMLVAGGAGDYSDQHLIEFSTGGLVDSTHPLQSLFTDGTVVLAASGDNVITNTKRLYSYSIRTGRVLAKDNGFSVGKSNAAADGAGTVYEIEGGAFLRDGAEYVPVIGVVSGDIGARRTRLYMLGKPLERFWRGLLVPYDIAGTASPVGNVYSGEYTPTATAVTNVSSSTTYPCQFMRVGNVVSVSGRIDITPTASATFSELDMTIPVPSDFDFGYRAAGTFRSNSTTAQQAGMIYSDSADDGVTFRYTPSATGSHAIFFQFSYKLR